MKVLFATFVGLMSLFRGSEATPCSGFNIYEPGDKAGVPSFKLVEGMKICPAEILKWEVQSICPGATTSAITKLFDKTLDQTIRRGNDKTKANGFYWNSYGSTTNPTTLKFSSTSSELVDGHEFCFYSYLDGANKPTQIVCFFVDCEPKTTVLLVDKTGPGAAFTNQEIEFSIKVKNVGTVKATNVVLEDLLPSGGSFDSSDPAGSLNGNVLTIPLNDLDVGSEVDVKVRWKTPQVEGTVVNTAAAKADNAAAASDNESVQVGIATIVTGGVTSAGTGLRNRPGGTISITGVPSGATVTRAVLVWAILVSGASPSNQITFQGTAITADLTATISGNLCWGDSQTIGYAADVTNLVSGNANYAITDAVNGVIRVDSDPSGALPYTDGASLFVFYGGPGIDDQVVSDFTYSTNTAGGNARSLTGFVSGGGVATLHLAGPDGQNNGGETVTVSATGTLNFPNTFDGSAPQQAPDFSIGNLWDNDIHDVSSILPVGHTTLDVFTGSGSDCIGLSAVALQVEK